MYRRWLYFTIIATALNAQGTQEIDSKRVYAFYYKHAIGTLEVKERTNQSFSFSINVATRSGCIAEIEGEAFWRTAQKAIFKNSSGSCQLVFYFDKNKVRVEQAGCMQYTSVACDFHHTYYLPSTYIKDTQTLYVWKTSDEGFGFRLQTSKNHFLEGIATFVSPYEAIYEASSCSLLFYFSNQTIKITQKTPCPKQAWKAFIGTYQKIHE